MSNRLRHHATIASLDEREAEIAAAWHVGRVSLLWAVAFVIAVVVGAPPSPAENVATQPDTTSPAAATAWGA
jgi:hypothetical protein